MDSPEQKSRVFIFMLVVVAIGVAFISYIISPPQWHLWISMIFFLLLACAADVLGVKMANGHTISVALSIELAIIILFGPFVAIVISTMSYLLSLVFFTKSTLSKVLFNLAQFTLCNGLAGILYVLFKGPATFVGLVNFLLAIGVAVVYLSINISLASKLISLYEENSPWGIFITSMRWATPNLIALAPLGFLMAVIFQSWSYWGLLIFFLPLLLARHSFKLYMDMKEVYLNTIKALVLAIEAKDAYTAGHSQRVSEYAVELAREMKISEDVIEELRYMALLHDVGKIGIHEAILNKGGQLTDEEYEKIQHHAVIGADIVKEVKGLDEVYRAVRHHHERWDGAGYPDGLKGTEIPLGARIIAVADTFDAMTSNRIYRRGLHPEIAFSEILRVAGAQLDPQMAVTFVDLYREKFKSEGYSAIKYQGVESGDLEGQE